MSENLSSGNGPVWAVVPAAGAGSRMNAAIPKQYIEINGVTVLQRTIDLLLALTSVSGIVVAISPEDERWSALSVGKNTRVHSVVGGKTRADSVIAALSRVCELANTNDVMALVHDAARAVTTQADIASLIQAVRSNPEQGGLLASRVADTLKQANNANCVARTVSRDGLWQAQTPQMFRASVLLQTLKDNKSSIDRGDITDEASAMELAGYSPVLVESLAPNFKITNNADLQLATALLQHREQD